MKGNADQTRVITSEPCGSTKMRKPTFKRIAPPESSTRFVELVPIGFARRFSVLGLNGDNGVLRVAAASLDDVALFDNLAVHLGQPIEPVLAPQEVIAAAINEAYSRQESQVDAVIEGIDMSADEDLSTVLTGHDLLDSDSAAPVIRLVNLVLFEAVKRRASDVHLQPFEDRLQVRLRVDGVLYDYVQPPQGLHDEMVSRIKVLGRMNIAEKRLAQDGRTTVSVGDRIVDLRISSLPTSHGERVVIRLLDKSARLYALPELGLSQRDLQGFRRLIRRTHGIILVTGPTGSGKSTTLYAALQELNCKELNILTLEDPIEYELSGISQTQVSAQKGLTFATGLRTVLRQDPDVIMVGEIRDQETARMAIQSSLTGHLVFSTLHTNDAAGAVSRLLDLGIEPYLVASSLSAVMAQRLVRRVCAECTRAAPLSDQDRKQLGLVEPGDDRQVARGTGCAHCFHTGYYERVGIFELLEVDDAIRQLIVARADAASIKRAAIRAGMSTLRRDALAKLLGGVTTVEEVLRVTQEDGVQNSELRVASYGLPLPGTGRDAPTQEVQNDGGL